MMVVIALAITTHMSAQEINKNDSLPNSLIIPEDDLKETILLTASEQLVNSNNSSFC